MLRVAILFVTLLVPCPVLAIMFKGSSDFTVTKHPAAYPHRVFVQMLVSPRNNKNFLGTLVIVGKGENIGEIETFEAIGVTHEVMKSVDGLEVKLDEPMWVRVPQYRRINGEMRKVIVDYPIAAFKHNDLTIEDFKNTDLPPDKNLIKFIVKVPPEQANPVDVVGNAQITSDGDLISDPGSKGSMGDNFQAYNNTSESILKKCTLPQNPLKSVYDENIDRISTEYNEDWFNKESKKEPYCSFSYDGSLEKGEQRLSIANVNGMYYFHLKNNSQYSAYGGASGGGFGGFLANGTFEILALHQSWECPLKERDYCIKNDLNKIIPYDKFHYHVATPTHYFKGSRKWPEIKVRQDGEQP
jgi:hypothetical protein